MHFEKLAGILDDLARYNADEIGEMYEGVRRGVTNRAHRDSCVAVIVGWLGLCAPFKKGQHYIDIAPLLSVVEASPEMYRDYLQCAVNTPNMGGYITLTTLDPKIGNEYLDYCISYYYANLDEFGKYGECVEDPDRH
jgi:hypothetical protein